MVRRVLTGMAVAALLCACQATNDCSQQPEAGGTVLTFPERSSRHGDILDMLRRKLEHCPDERWIQSASAISGCNMDVVAGADRLLSASQSNMGELLTDLSGPLMRARTGGESALSEMNLVSGELAAFAIDRVAILRGIAAFQTHQPKAPPPRMFGWIEDKERQASIRKRWVRARDDDCRAYPVPHCAAKLDQAFARLMSVANSDWQAPRA